MNIFGIKLVSGEDILARIESSESRTIGPQMMTLINPAIIAMMQGASGPTLGMADFLPFAEKKTIKMEDTKIMFMYVPDQKLLNAYNAQFGSGLVVAKTMPPDNANILPFTKPSN